LNFLTGINGSGKTTVLNSVSALLGPSLPYLADTDFHELALTLHQADAEITVTAEKSDKHLLLSCTAVKEQLSLPLSAFSAASERRHEAAPGELGRELLLSNRGHPLIEFLSSLPSPMTLGIARRAPSAEDEAALHRVPRHRLIGGSPHALSLAQAASLAERKYSSVQTALRELATLLRKNLILNALRFEQSDLAHPGLAELPEVGPSQLSSLRTTLRELGLTEDDLKTHLEPFLERLARIQAQMPFDKDLKKAIEDRNLDRRSAFLDWFSNAAQFQRLFSIIGSAQDFIRQSQRANEPLSRYLTNVNGFLADSHKELAFDHSGSLVVKLRNHATRPMSALSSGEMQLVVILTHLAFNPDTDRANVVIIDEPELSLHIRWQELFVNALRTVNPRAQLVLATHSPSIILDDVANCIDLSSSLLP
jgi:energy-coupling factor transporter ATP-binding protein EcfA2